MRRELGRGLVQDQAKKGERLAIRVDPAAVATATPVSHSSYGAPNAGLPTTLLCPNDPYPNTGQVKGGHGQDQDQAVERFGRGELTAVDPPHPLAGWCSSRQDKAIPFCPTTSSGCLRGVTRVRHQ